MAVREKKCGVILPIAKQRLIQKERKRKVELITFSVLLTKR